MSETKKIRKDYTDQIVNGFRIIKFNSWHTRNSGTNISKWLVECKYCLKEFVSFIGSLKNDVGCRCRRDKHGMWQHQEYHRWTGIKQRCYNENKDGYAGYGGRGIVMYEPWINDFNAFHTWIQENLGECPNKYTLDRIDVNGNYEPGNLRWLDSKGQHANRRPIISNEQIAKIVSMRDQGINLNQIIKTIKGL